MTSWISLLDLSTDIIFHTHSRFLSVASALMKPVSALSRYNLTITLLFHIAMIQRYSTTTFKDLNVDSVLTITYSDGGKRDVIKN